MILNPGGLFLDPAGSIDLTNNELLINGTDLTTVRSEIVGHQLKTTAGTSNNALGSADLAAASLMN